MTGGERRGRAHQASDEKNGRVETTEPPKKEPEDEGAWPASLRRYLQRAFDKCDKKQGSRQHALLEKALHRKVTDAMANNDLLTKDWDNEPLPRCALVPCSVGSGVAGLVKYSLCWYINACICVSRNPDQMSCAILLCFVCYSLLPPKRERSPSRSMRNSQGEKSKKRR